MSGIIRTALRFRLLAVAAAAGVLALGLATLREAPVDVLPEFSPTYAEIQTEALGLSATEVENLITLPLEADLLNGVQGVDIIRSQSLPGLSSIVLVFEPGTDIYRARQLVEERLAQAHALPRVSKPPTLLPPLSSSSRVLMVGLSSERISPIEMSIMARWTIKPRLMGVPGVANVAIWGLREEQVQVLVDPERLRDRGVTLNQVIRTSGNAQIVSPLTFLEASTPGAGGFIETPQQRLQVRNVLERLADPDELGKVPVEDTGSRLRLRDVASVEIGHQPLIGDAVVNDGSGLLLVVEKFPGTDTVEVTEGVEEALETLQPGLSGLRTDSSVFRPADYIEKALDNLTLVLLIGGALVALAIAALLLQWRAVLIALLTIPVSLVTAALVLDAFGQTFNAMSLAGLVLALVLVLDDAVAAAEGVATRLRGAERGSPVMPVVVNHAIEQRRALAYGTLVGLLATVPLVAMQGRPGAFLEPAALAFLVAVVAASLVAVTLTPVLVLLLFSIGRPAARVSPLLSGLRRAFERALAACLGRQRAVLIAACALGIAALALLPAFKTSVIPPFEDRDLSIRLTAEPGASNPKVTAIAGALSRQLRAVPGVENVGAHVGRAITGDQEVDVNSSEVWVKIGDSADYDDTVQQIEAVVGGLRGVEREVRTYSTSRIRDIGTLHTGSEPPTGEGFDVLTGSDEPLTARVYGHDLAELERQAARVRDLMAGVDGVAAPEVRRPEEQPNVVIEVDLARAQRFGIKPGDVRRAEAALVQGIHVGSVFIDQRIIDVIVQGAPGTRQSVSDIRRLLIDRPGGGHLRLEQVADVRIEPTPVALQREAVSRYLDVTAGVTGRDAADVAADLRDRLSALDFPLEYHVEVFEAATADEIGTATVIGISAVAVLGAFLLLQAAFQSWGLALLGFLLLPAALSGGVLAALVTGRELTVGSALGFIGLLAVAARWTVLSVRRFQELEVLSAASPRSQIGRGVAERLAPVLTTACALAVAIVPILVLGSQAGLELLHPMAVVMLGGLVTTVAVGLLVLPTMYVRFARPMAEGAVRWQRIEVLPRSAAAGAGTASASAGGGGSTNGAPATEATQPSKP